MKLQNLIEMGRSVGVTIISNNSKDMGDNAELQPVCCPLLVVIKMLQNWTTLQTTNKQETSFLLVMFAIIPRGAIESCQCTRKQNTRVFVILAPSVDTRQSSDTVSNATWTYNMKTRDMLVTPVDSLPVTHMNSNYIESRSMRE